MNEYRLLLDYEVVEQVGRLPKAARVAIHQRLQAIRRTPDQFSDYDKTSPNGRRMDVNIFGKFAIEFWIDFADRHVKIMALRAADQGDRA